MESPNIHYRNLNKDHIKETLTIDKLISISDSDFHFWFNIDNLQTYEIDCFLIHKKAGVFVIEIKSIPIESIESYDRDTFKISKRSPEKNPNKKTNEISMDLKKYFNKHCNGIPFLAGTTLWSHISRGEWTTNKETKEESDNIESMIFMEDLMDLESLKKRLEYIYENPPVRTGSKIKFRFYKEQFDQIKNALNIKSHIPLSEPHSKKTNTQIEPPNLISQEPINPLFRLEFIIKKLNFEHQEWKIKTGDKFIWSNFKNELDQTVEILKPLKDSTSESLPSLVRKTKDQLLDLFEQNVILKNLHINSNLVVSENFVNIKNEILKTIKSAESFITTMPNRITNINDQKKLLILQEKYNTIEDELNNDPLTEELHNKVLLFQELWDFFITCLAKTKLNQRKTLVLKFLDRLDITAEQESLVVRDIEGHYRIQGVSGSGKTVVLIHRALRLAKENPSNEIYIFTVNRALAKLIQEKVESVSGYLIENIKVFAFYDFLLDCISEFSDTQKYRLTDDRSGERIQISWQDFCKHQNNIFSKIDSQNLLFYIRTQIEKETGEYAKVVVKSFKNLTIPIWDNSNAFEYIREEIIYIQSAFGSENRLSYLEMDRTGRAIPLTKDRRKVILDILTAWEEWLDFGDLCDINGLTHYANKILTDPKKLKKIRKKFLADHILVDECQDFSTLEICILKSIHDNPEKLNAFFFVGDLNQKIYSKHCNYKKAGFSFLGKSVNLSQNYRNTQEILLAAYALITKFPPPKEEDIELIDPKLSSYSGDKPIAISVDSFRSHLAIIIQLAKSNKEFKTAIITDNTKLTNALLQELNNADICNVNIKSNNDLDLWIENEEKLFSENVVVAKIDAVKGFEFDVVILADITANQTPPTGIPKNEMWKQAANVYCAMTRARERLIITYENIPSTFLTTIRKHLKWINDLNLIENS